MINNIDNIVYLDKHKKDKEFLLNRKEKEEKEKKFQKFVKEFYELLDKYEYKQSDKTNDEYLAEIIILNKINT